jgi:hypothetical protein
MARPRRWPGVVRLGVEQQVAELDHGESVDHAVVRLADERRRVAGDPHLPQRPVARQRRGEHLVHDVTVGHVEVAGGIEVRVVDPHRVMHAERHVGQLLAIAVRALHARRDVRDQLLRGGRPVGGRVEARDPADVHRRQRALHGQERGVERRQPLRNGSRQADPPPR